MILQKTDSGDIEVVVEGPFLFLQFNCDCKDALPYCNALCCRMRMAYNVDVSDEESQRLGGVTAQLNGKELKVLPSTPEFDCKYLSEEASCTVYEQRPHHCQRWHCSPKGNMNDALVTKRDRGWLLMPSGARNETE